MTNPPQNNRYVVNQNPRYEPYNNIPQVPEGYHQNKVDNWNHFSMSHPQFDSIENYSLTPSMSTSQDNSLYTSPQFPTGTAGASPIVRNANNWVIDNFEFFEGSSIARCHIYVMYMNHCNMLGETYINQASFGKLLRSLFSGIRTRRLGTRGNSKYHYYGIRLKGGNRNLDTSTSESKIEEPASDSSNFLQFPTIMVTAPSKYTQDALVFVFLYKKNLAKSYQYFINFQFQAVYDIWRLFWLAEFSHGNDKLEKKQLKSALSQDSVLSFIFQTDCIFFQHLLETFVPDNLITEVSSDLFQNFAQEVESKVTSIVQCHSNPTLTAIKSSVAASFTQCYNIRLSFNILARNIRKIAECDKNNDAMLAEIESIDFCGLRAQLAWMLNCGDDVIKSIEIGFVAGVRSFLSMKAWKKWILDIIDSSVEWPPSENNYRSVISRWALFLNLVIRELTFRRSAVLWNFHLFHYLCQDYMYYVCRTKLGYSFKSLAVEMISGKVDPDHLINVLEHRSVVITDGNVFPNTFPYSSS